MAQEIEGQSWIEQVAKNYWRGQRLLRTLPSMAQSEMEALFEQEYPGFSGDAAPICKRSRSVLHPRGDKNLAHIYAFYETKRQPGKARLTTKTTAREVELTVEPDDGQSESRVIEGPGIEADEDYAYYYKVVQGSNKVHDYDTIFRLETAYTASEIQLADFYKAWGVRSTCIAGGGEPLLNPGLPAFLERLHEHGIEAGIITNGSLLTEPLNEVISRTCRWVGVSMDAGSSEVYNVVKGLETDGMFARVVDNMNSLVDWCKVSDNTCDVAYKYLLHPLNAYDIHDAARLAKQIGCKDFHMRPVGWDNLTVTAHQPDISFATLLGEVDYQSRNARQDFEDESFRFFGIKHKFNPNMTRKVNFSSCLAAPMILTFGADGNCHLCFNRRGDKELILCSHDPYPGEVLNHWGSKRHVEILEDIDVNKCPRCTFGPYNEIIEQVFIEDGMCRNFP